MGAAKELGMSAANSAIGGALGIIAGGINDRRQLKQQEKLNAMQKRDNKEMTIFNREQQMKMWEDTNYNAQRKQMEKAGLNVGLMYGMGGVGGQSTNVATGNQQGGQASGHSGEVQQGMAMMLQNQLVQAQKENIEADTVKKGAEKTEIEARTPTYEKGMSKTDAEIEEIASKIGVNASAVRKMLQEIAESESRIPVNEAQKENIQAQTERTKQLTPIEVQKLKADTKAQIIKNVYLNEKEQAELDNMLQDIVNKKTQLEQTGEKLDIDTFEAKMRAEYPSLWNVGGKVLDASMRMLIHSLGGNADGAIRGIPKRN